MNHFSTIGRRTIALGATSALVVAGATVAVAAPVLADTERHGACSQGNARYDFDVDRDDGRFEVDLEVESNRPGQKWRLKLFHDGERVLSTVRRTDREGEVEYDRDLRNTAGKDAFRARAVNLGNGEVCTARIVRR